ncbi:hypothetical protein BOVATA_012310 [Babesia ovata]|uniref:Uncharacterized protein n=1 Tax=Babesia ovata TaxID=189622 RepID=A0A2H6K9S9_9APIC|nr:uncharacterized protein BOVATA_012310 [Babesia ovata]GBE59738.1 hypothetical protein BOVATA_012310 [Babesia ovata]
MAPCATSARIGIIRLGGAGSASDPRRPYLSITAGRDNSRVFQDVESRLRKAVDGHIPVPPEENIWMDARLVGFKPS